MRSFDKCCYILLLLFLFLYPQQQFSAYLSEILRALILFILLDASSQLKPQLDCQN